MWSKFRRSSGVPGYRVSFRSSSLREYRRLLMLVLFVASALSFAHPQATKTPPPASAKPAASTVEPFMFVDPAKSGIRWVHSAGRSPEHYLPESSGAGCAFLDYDNDGWMDIYLVNSGKSEFFDPKPPLRNALYHNNHDGTFTDVTDKAGVPGTGYGMGVAVGDYDGDGFPDLYVTQYGKNVLYHNNGNGTFTDVTDKAGVGAAGWSSSAVWFDYDNDGKLDLFVAQFAHLDLQVGCGVFADGKRHYCIPTIFEPRRSWLFHNNGDGTFTDVSKESGIADHLGKAWGAVATDIDNDGWMDLFVANDTVPNLLLRNKGNGHFEDIALAADVAYSDEGKARSGMGVDSADYDEDGWPDIFVANIDQEIFSLYRNNHDKTFTDQAMQSGVGMSTRWMSGWGLKFLDFDNDGRLDVIVANGFPDDAIDETSTEVKYKEPLLLFKNTGEGFRDVSAQSGPVFEQHYAARGLAIGDYPDFVDRGIDDEFEQERCGDAADHRRGNTLHHVGTGARRPHDGKQADAGGERHELRPQALGGSLNDGLTQLAETVQAAFAPGLLVGQVEVEQHEDSGLGVDPQQGNQAHPHGDAHVVAGQIQKPETAPTAEKRHGQQAHDHCLGHRARVRCTARRQIRCEREQGPPASGAVSPAAWLRTARSRRSSSRAAVPSSFS
jgi:hypothetical protein